MRILVTGAAGFVGTNLTTRLLNDGYDVVAVDSLSRRGAEHNLRWLQARHAALKFRRREIEDIAGLIYEERPRVVFHFAAQVAVTSSVENPLRDFRINAEGTFLVARAAYDIGAPVIYTSTNKVYGDNVNDVPLIEEETRYDFQGPYQGRGLPESFSIDSRHHTPYGISKLVGELYVREFGGIANRCSCMYGPNQYGLVDQGWLSHIATNKVMDRETVIYGDGKQVRDALHIRDVVALLSAEMHALTGPARETVAGRAFNVGGGFRNTISLIELCQKWDIVPTFCEWRPADQKVFYCDVTAARSAFGWQPEVSLEDGLNELLEWTRASCGSPAYASA
jgi:CDP-paratose 2-epimerase